MFDALRPEMRHAVRSLARRPALTLAALATLTLGVGANGAVFSVLNSLVLRPLPFTAADRLVAVWPDHFVAHRELAYLRENLRSLDQVASVSPGWLMALTSVSQPTEVTGVGISANLFGMLGARPQLGRSFAPDADQPGGPREVVLSHELWVAQFGADPDIVGHSITLDRQSWQVIGVMERGFQVLNHNSDLWFILPIDPNGQFWVNAITLLVGRLAPGASLAAANAEFGPVTQRMVAHFAQPPESAEGANLVGLKEHIVGPVQPMMFVLFGAVLFILAIAAANVASLLLVRATERRTELAVRISLGASRYALVRQVALESLVLAITGGCAGLGLAVLGVRVLRTLLPADTPRLMELGLDWRVALYSAAITLTVGLAATLAPALLTRAERLSGYLRAGRTVAGGAQRARGLLIVSEIALALVLVSGATLMLRTLAQLHRVDPGFRTSRVLTMRVQPSHLNRTELPGYWRDLLTKLDAIPGVDAAGTVLHLPMSGRAWMTALDVEGVTLPPGAVPQRSPWQTIGGDYFRAMGIQLLSGRGFLESDHENAPRVVIVNDRLAAILWPSGDVLGKRIRAGRATSQEWATVIGVVRAVRHDSLSREPGPELYTHFPQNPVVSTSLVLSTTGDPRGLAAPVRTVIWNSSRDVPISNVRTIDEVLTRSTTRYRVILVLLATFACVGLLLGLVGIYGLVAHSVRQRTREIGIRMALGATPRNVLSLMTTIGLRWAALGIGFGLPLALALSRYLRGLMYGVAASDPFTFTIVPLLLFLCACAAAYLPARRAAATPPATVLNE